MTFNSFGLLAWGGSMERTSRPDYQRPVPRDTHLAAEANGTMAKKSSHRPDYKMPASILDPPSGRSLSEDAYSILDEFADGKTTWSGGWPSNLQNQGEGYGFDSSGPHDLIYRNFHSADLESIAKHIKKKAEEGSSTICMDPAFEVALSRHNTRAEKDLEITRMWSDNIGDILRTLGDQLFSHKVTLSIDWKNDLVITSDRLVSSVGYKLGVRTESPSTLRFWSLKDREIRRTLSVTTGVEIQDIKFVPGNRESIAIATTVDLGQAWVIYPFRKDSDGDDGTIKLLYDLGGQDRGGKASPFFHHLGG